ncbi:ENDD1 protein, partial [Serilophus lunatus]|nr:ENDD1 protein [Serilophus lunatus]
MLWLLLLQVWASCLWLGHSEVVPSFANSCPQFFYQNTPPNNVLQPANPAWICQRFNNRYHFATLYDSRRRIPVYSAYIYQPGPGCRSQDWMVEPQLINSNLPKEMKTESDLITNYKVKLQQIRQSQAVFHDYTGLKTLNRGHLNPCGHHNTPDSRNATFTLTNIVPQDKTLNGGAWNNYEQQTMAQNAIGCVRTYVIVGAVPGNTFIANRRVNVPSYIWSSACCQTNTGMKAWGAIAANNQNQVTVLKLGQLEAQLTQLYKGPVVLFDSNCPR